MEHTERQATLMDEEAERIFIDYLKTRYSLASNDVPKERRQTLKDGSIMVVKEKTCWNGSMPTLVAHLEPSHRNYRNYSHLLGRDRVEKDGMIWELGEPLYYKETDSDL